MLRRLVALIMSVIVLSGAAAAAPVALHRGNSAEPDTLDPQKYGLTIEGAILTDLFEGLTTLSARGEPLPGIAESWTVSADASVYTFTLREGLLWSDGAPLTIDDVIAGFRRAVDPKTASQLVDLGFIVKNAAAITRGDMDVTALGVRALDNRRIEITLERPSATFLTLIAGFPLFSPVPRHVLAQYGDDWIKPGHMVSNGAYQLAEWVTNSHVKLVRNPRFRDNANVQIDEVTFYPTVDEASAVKRFRAGELDFNLGFPPAQKDFLKAELPGAVRIDPASTVNFIVFNLGVAKFQDPRVRRALSLAIDRAVLTDRILNAGQTPAYSVFPVMSEMFRPSGAADFSGQSMEARLAEAQRLLAEAGYGPQNPLRFRLDFRANDTNRRVIAAIAEMWARAGVEVQLQANEAKVHYALLRVSDFEAGDGGWQADPDPDFFVRLLTTGSEFNYARWSDPRYDALVEQAGAALDPETRRRLYQQADDIAMGDTALLPLFYGAHRSLVAAHVKGFEGNPINTHPTRFLRIER